MNEIKKDENVFFNTITNEEKLIETENLSVGYENKLLISKINFCVNSGEIVTLIGPNGSGKSTVLKTIAKQIKSKGGRISILGKEISLLRESEIAKKISLVMTERIRPELMTCRDVVATGRFPYTGRLGLLGEKDWKIVDDAIKLVHAEEIAGRNFLETSDGQRQRIMLARAICQDTPVIILDEPTSFLDMFYKIDIIRTIWKLARTQKKSIVMSLHELDLVRAVSDKIICVDGNSVCKIGSVSDVFCGGFIQKLYGLNEDEFDEQTGTMKLNLR
ncbi:MAG: ABC transporter ATP-binding protein [Treponema sp.]|nr:ABC transporter ATP-binding protein [Treponema sp.]